MFTQNNLIEFGLTDEQIASMNEKLLGLYPQANDDDADEQLVKHYSDTVIDMLDGNGNIA